MTILQRTDFRLMKLAFDTYYSHGTARTVALAFADWHQDREDFYYSEILTTPAEYKSGSFYKRELPCILSLLKKIDLKQTEVIIVDSFVFLDDQLKPGLGARLYENLGSRIPVIGVAKTDFLSLHLHKEKILRGKSSQPLYITAVGTDLNEAANHIREMHGSFRIPTLLKRLDLMTRTTDTPTCNNHSPETAHTASERFLIQTC